MVINLIDKEVNVIVNRKRIKNVYFRVDESNNLVISANKNVSDLEIKRLIKENEKSLYRMLDREEKKNLRKEEFYYLGEKYVVVTDPSYKDVSISDGFIYTPNEKKLEKWYKTECFRVFKERLDYLMKDFKNIPPFTLRVRKMKTRWGVNNFSSKSITLNSELLRYRIPLIDYVIVHELCHFYQANHSSLFWKEVSLRYPNYKEARKELRY